MDYKGTIIEESLDNKDVLKELKILHTRVEKVVAKHQTPWLKQWTLHLVEIKEDMADQIAQNLSHSLEKTHNWYADYKNSEYHYIIFLDKIFKIKRVDARGYQKAREYGISLGIPEHQVDFSPEID